VQEKKPGGLPVKTKKPSYYIQVGAFRERQHARNIIKRLRKRGWALTMHRKKNGLFAVWVGPLATRADARVAKKKLRSQHIQGFIVIPPTR
jgi:cell division septation protein DedD